MKKNNTISYKHSINLGDLYSIMPGLKEINHKYGRKARLYQRINMPGHYYNGATHPTKDESGAEVTMNKNMFEMVKPLIEYQPYIDSFQLWKGEKIEVDFDKMRSNHVGMPNGSINRWPFYLWPDMATDLSKKWFSVPRKVDSRTKGKILINFTSRYRNHMISYFFLKEYHDRIIFTGTKEEYEFFIAEWDLKMPYLEVNDFLELAIAINSCKLFVGNQSSAFQIAEGLKVNRAVDLCSFAPNVIPHGANGYDFYHQEAAEYYFKELSK